MRERLSRCVLIPALMVSLFIVLILCTYSTNRVVGIVVDEETGVPLADAVVHLPDGVLLPANDAGSFELTTPRGALPLDIEAPGYETLASRCDAFNFLLGPVRCRFALRPEVFVVQVSDGLDSTRAVDGVQVQANGIPLSRAEDGSYAGKRLVAPFEVRVSGPGYLPWQGIEYEALSLTARLEPTWVRGIVRAADTGAPLPDAIVEVLGVATKTDNEGRFEFIRVTGSFQPRAHLAGFHRYYGDLVGRDMLLAGQPLELLMNPIYSSGRVIDVHTGQPIAGARVSTPNQAVYTDDKGIYALRALLPGVVASVQASDYFGAYVDHARAGTLDVSLQSAKMDVLVSDLRTGHPLEGAQIQTDMGTVFTDAEGRGAVIGLPPGRPVTVTAIDYYDARFDYTGQPVTSTSLRQIRTTVVVSDALTGQPITGARAQTASGAVFTDADGECTVIGLLPGSAITIESDNHAPLTVTHAGEDPLKLTLLPVRVAVTIVDGESGEGIPGLQVWDGSVIMQPGRDDQYTISSWAPEQTYTLRAAGYRIHEFSINPASLNSAPEPELPRLRISEQSTGNQPALRLDVPRFALKAIYIPFGLLTRPEIIEDLLRLVQETELNAVVIDMKGDRGFLGYRSQIPLAWDLGVLRRDVIDIRDLLRQCREAGIYTIARQVVFKDHPLATQKPEWAAVNAEGVVWLDREGLGWASPFVQEVKDYNIAIAVEIAALGFDEIQFDYLRFPSDGDVTQIVYQQENTLETRAAAITTFVQQVTVALQPFGIFTSADVFGLTLWVEPWHDMGIGQRVQDIAPYIDYLCPMVYPSTFGAGNLGYQNPSDHPYEVVSRSVVQASLRVPPTTRIRPWLQGYWYTLEEYLLLKKAAIDSGASGWCFWNARGQYVPGLFEAAAP